MKLTIRMISRDSWRNQFFGILFSHSNACIEITICKKNNKKKKEKIKHTNL